MTVEQELSLTGSKKQTENWDQSHACFSAAATMATVPDVSNEVASVYIDADIEIDTISNTSLFPYTFISWIFMSPLRSFLLLLLFSK